MDSPPSNGAIHSECDIKNVSPDTVIHINCFNDYDPSSLGNIEPDINYSNACNTLNNTPHYDDQTFRDKKWKQYKIVNVSLKCKEYSGSFY